MPRPARAGPTGAKPRSQLGKPRPRPSPCRSTAHGWDCGGSPRGALMYEFRNRRPLSSRVSRLGRIAAMGAAIPLTLSLLALADPAQPSAQVSQSEPHAALESKRLARGRDARSRADAASSRASQVGAQTSTAALSGTRPRPERAAAAVPSGADRRTARPRRDHEPAFTAHRARDAADGCRRTRHLRAADQGRRVLGGIRPGAAPRMVARGSDRGDADGSRRRVGRRRPTRSSLAPGRSRTTDAATSAACTRTR